MAKNESKLEKKLPQGRPRLTHGAVSYIVHGRLPEHRAYLRRFLTTVRESLIADHGGEENMSTAQLILTDRIISKLAICRLVEEYAKEQGVFRSGELQAVLKQNYLAYSNSLRLDLQALGFDQKAGDNVLSPLEYIKQFDEKKAQQENSATGGKDTTKTLSQDKKGAPEASQSDILQGK